MRRVRSPYARRAQAQVVQPVSETVFDRIVRLCAQIRAQVGVIEAEARIARERDELVDVVGIIRRLTAAADTLTAHTPADEMRRIVAEEIARAFRRPMYVHASGRIVYDPAGISSRAARDPGDNNDDASKPPQGITHDRGRTPSAEP